MVVRVKHDDNAVEPQPFADSKCTMMLQIVYGIYAFNLVISDGDEMRDSDINIRFDIVAMCGQLLTGLRSGRYPPLLMSALIHV